MVRAQDILYALQRTEYSVGTEYAIFALLSIAQRKHSLVAFVLISSVHSSRGESSHPAVSCMQWVLAPVGPESSEHDHPCVCAAWGKRTPVRSGSASRSRDTKSRRAPNCFNSEEQSEMRSIDRGARGQMPLTRGKKA